jgi:hypothetical protein
VLEEACRPGGGDLESACRGLETELEALRAAVERRRAERGPVAAVG